MADGKEAAAVQMSVANPKQEVNAMENLDKVTSYTTPTYNLETNPTQFKQEKNQSFFDSEAWKDYKSNLLRAYSNEYPGFTSIEKVAENDLWRDSLGANSDFVVKRAQAIHSSYAYATGWWGKLAEAYNAQRFGLRAAAARKDLSDAIREGDELKIAEAKIKYEQEKRRIYERGHEYDEYGNTLMSLAASSGRNWETIPINIAGVFFAPVTGGLSLGASQAINAGIVGADTYRLETGTGLEQLDELDTDLTEEQRNNPSIEFIMPANEVRLVAKYNKISPINLILGDGTQVEFEGKESKNITFFAPESSNNRSFAAWKIDGYVYFDIGRAVEITIPDRAINIEAIY